MYGVCVPAGRSLPRTSHSSRPSPQTPQTPQGYFPGAQELTLRLVYDKAPAARGKLLGAQAFGRAGVEKRVDAAAVALQGGLALSDLAEVDLSYAPPYSSANDPLNLAAFVGMNDLSGAFVVGLGFKKGECGAWRV